jgi:hypothetical protein
MLRQALLAVALPLTCFAHSFAQAPSAAEAAQQSAAPAGSNWQRVLALPVGSYLHVNARTRHTICWLKAVDGETLTCTHDTGVGSKEVVFQRAEITTVKLARRGRSGVLGASIAAGAGAIAGGIQGARSNYFAVRGAFAMIYAFAGAFLGGPAGYLTDFSAMTIYRAPQDGLTTQKGGHGYK